jgi:hypothetical protein
MPVPGNHFDVLMVPMLQLAEQAGNEDHGKQQNPDDDVAGV